MLAFCLYIYSHPPLFFPASLSPCLLQVVIASPTLTYLLFINIKIHIFSCLYISNREEQRNISFRTIV